MEQAVDRRTSPIALACVAVVVAALAGGCPSTKGVGLTFGLTAEQHASYFPITKGKPHELGKHADDGAISCDSCHKGGDSFAAFTCVSCHEHRQDLIDSQHAGVTGYRYDSASCLECHSKGDVDNEIDRGTHSTQYFPIDTTDVHGAVQCAACHVVAGDRSKVSCTSCHDQDPNSPPGVGVHDASPLAAVHGDMPAPKAGEQGYAWDTAACIVCHAKSENPGQYDHEPFFPTKSPAVHAGISCKQCHASAGDRSQLSCTSCHDHEKTKTDSQHTGVTGYTYDSGSCYACHQHSEVPGTFSHDSFFPIGAGTSHALGSNDVADGVTIACTTCHTDPTDNTKVDCVSCHTHAEDQLAPIHAGNPDYVWSDSGCLFCHPGDDPNGRLTNHTQFPTATGTVHAGINCRQCHASLTDRTQLLCTQCHLLTDMQPIHQSLPGFTYDSTACYSCHQSSQVPGAFDHESYFPLVNTVHAVVGTLNASNALVCADCHVSRVDRTQLACTTCHLGSHDKAPMDSAHSGIPNYSWSPQSCFSCHPNGTAAGATFSHPFFPIAATDTHGQNGITCADCHTTPGDNSKVDCTHCHLGTHDQAPMTTTHNGVPGFQWATSQCLFCHPHSEPVGNIDHAQFFPITAGTAHAGIDCNSCHIDPNNRDNVGCAQCHANDTNPTITAAHTGIPGFQNTSTACLQCHPQSENPGIMDHSAYFPIAAGSKHASSAYNAKIASGQNQCSACHASRTDRTQELCSQCHAGVSPTPSSSHGQVNGFSNNSVNCKQCHADSQVDTVASHTVFNPRHHGAKCVDCHRTFRSDKPWGVDFTKGVCTKCHSSSCNVNNQNACGG